jgi:RimJ/RimL family protein N-acetyltransferase
VIADAIGFPLGVLRPLAPDDAAALARACADEHIARWTQVPQPYGIDDAREFIASRAGEDKVWAIDVDGLAGVIGLRNTRYVMPGPVSEVGYWVAAWARGRGVASGALIAVRDAAAADGYQRVEWSALAGNEASLRTALRAGFTVEGHLRRGLVHRGRLVDAVVGSWTPRLEAPELVAGIWQLQPVEPGDVPGELRPAASSALAAWVVRAAVGGAAHGHVLALRSRSGVHVVGIGCDDVATAAARRYAQAVGWECVDAPLPEGWI